jgi:hypothetical protein
MPLLPPVMSATLSLTFINIPPFHKKKYDLISLSNLMLSVKKTDYAFRNTAANQSDVIKPTQKAYESYVAKTVTSLRRSAIL